ncbi:MAG: phenylalanine--tRNA ligase subunit beta [Acidimicrobiales bacterium]
MKVLHTWLAEYVPGLLEHPVGGDPDALGDVMSALGLCCEEVVRVGDGLDGVIVAKVLALAPHPDADRIQLVQVDVGDGEALQICCGAFNMAVGDLVPLATLGTTMPNGMEIARRKLRGEWSNGMLCAADELEVGDDHDGILILDPSLALGTPIAEALGVVPDAVFDLDLTPNRPDALSVVGVARDVAATLGLPFVLPDIVVPEVGAPASELASVAIGDPGLCGRFSARVLSGVTIGSSPQWMQQRLTLCGMRPINSVVDVSNYVMLEYGQPNHTYDLATVPDGRLGVRRATEGERIVTLDGQTRTLEAGDGVIVNAADEPIGIAGVMGGESTEIGDGTETVLLELAWWDPASISRTSKRLGLRSEASARYEKGVDPEVAGRAALRFAELLVSFGATLHPGALVAEGTLPDVATPTVRAARVNAILGSSLTIEQITGYLDSIGFASVPTDDPDVVTVTIPSWRPDSTAEIDVIEEVARLHGYANLGKTVPTSSRAGGLSERQADIRRLRSFLTSVGASEAMPMSFLAPGDLEATGVRVDGITVANPLVAEESVLRTSLLPGLIKTLGYNAAHRQTGVSLFEIGHCFAAAHDGGLPVEWEEVAVVLGGHDARDAVELAKRVAALVGIGELTVVNQPLGGLHPGRSARLLAGGVEIGAVGEVDPATCEQHGVAERVGYVSFVLGGPEYWHGDAGLLSVPRGDRTFSPISRMPSSDVDLAFVVDDAVGADELAATLRLAGGELVTSVELFDVYRGASVGEGRRSLAYRLRIQATDHTLTDVELAEVRSSVVGAAADTHGATLR